MRKNKMDVISVRKIGIGVSNFKKMIQRDSLFVDKSLFIQEIIESYF